jgi:hypothetical protein
MAILFIDHLLGRDPTEHRANLCEPQHILVHNCGAQHQPPPCADAKLELARLFRDRNGAPIASLYECGKIAAASRLRLQVLAVATPRI